MLFSDAQKTDELSFLTRLQNEEKQRKKMLARVLLFALFSATLATIFGPTTGTTWPTPPDETKLQQCFCSDGRGSINAPRGAVRLAQNHYLKIQISSLSSALSALRKCKVRASFWSPVCFTNSWLTSSMLKAKLQVHFGLY